MSAGLVLGKVTITKILTDDDRVLHSIETDNGAGEAMSLDDALVMMQRASFALMMAEVAETEITYGEDESEADG